MTKAIALVTLDRVGGLPEDVVVNTWHFEDDSTGIGDSGGIAQNGPGLVARLQAFYESIGQSLLGSALTGTGTVKLYDWGDPLPRIPRRVATISFPKGTTCYPAEVALVLSFKAADLAGGIPARRRGRVYLGPIKVAAGVNDPDARDVRPSEATMTSVLNAAKAMADGGPGAFKLATYSPTQAALTGGADAAWNDVAELRIDNAFDTQRRRGAARSKRMRVSLTGADAPVLFA